MNMNKLLRFFPTATLALALSLSLSCSEKCGGKKYDPKTQFCYNGSEIVDKCGGNEYNPEAQFCGKDVVLEKCGGNAYDHEAQFCSGDAVLDKCGGKEYDPAAQLCDSRDNTLYKHVKINAQTWMAENLNFKTEYSKCYGDADSNCVKYGRLYGQDTSACPSGWRLPSKSDWGALVKAAGGSNVAGKKLKSKSGWNKNGNGTDEFGFSALPGGNHFAAQYEEGDSFSDFNFVGERGFWWSSTAIAPSGSFYQYMSNSSGKAELGSVGGDMGGWESGMYSIRCIQK